MLVDKDAYWLCLYLLRIGNWILYVQVIAALTTFGSHHFSFASLRALWLAEDLFIFFLVLKYLSPMRIHAWITCFPSICRLNNPMISHMSSLTCSFFLIQKEFITASQSSNLIYFIFICLYNSRCSLFIFLGYALLDWCYGMSCKILTKL